MGHTQKNRDHLGNPVGGHLTRVNIRLLGTELAILLSSGITEDDRSFAFSYALGVEMLLQGCLCYKEHYGSFKRLLLNVLDAKDVLGFIDACSLMRHSLVTSGRCELEVFKPLRHRWVGGLATAIIAALGSPVVHPSDDFNRVATFLGWLKRLPVCIRPENEAVDAYYECDRRLDGVDPLSSKYYPMVEKIWREWFSTFTLRFPFLPKHGSGSTADQGRVRANKWRSLTTDRRSSVLLRYPTLERALDDSIEIEDKPRISTVVFVPKQAGKHRTICMEPAWLQYLQQGIASQIRQFAESYHHPLHRIVNIGSQEQNRALCAWAYSEGLATVDLSDASDSVKWDLVLAISRGLPLARYLSATRSDHTLIDGRVVRMTKYAPMGSALCFPIECYIFSSMVECAYRLHYGKASTGYRNGISVYGDDIICPAEIYHLLTDILTSFGFLVNASKSFNTGIYYESCGVEYCLGVRIYTVKHPRAHLLCDRVCTPDVVGLVTDLSNVLYAAGYFRCRRLLLQYFSQKLVRTDSGSATLASLLRFDDMGINPIVEDFHRTKWSTKLHRPVRKRLAVVTSNEKDKEDFQEWKASLRPRSRHQRLKDLYHSFREVRIDPTLSVKAVLYLSKFRFFEMLEEGSRKVEAHGTSNTGRLHSRIRSQIG